MRERMNGRQNERTRLKECMRKEVQEMTGRQEEGVCERGNPREQKSDYENERKRGDD